MKIGREKSLKRFYERGASSVMREVKTFRLVNNFLGCLVLGLKERLVYLINITIQELEINASAF